MNLGRLPVKSLGRSELFRKNWKTRGGGGKEKTEKKDTIKTESEVKSKATKETNNKDKSKGAAKSKAAGTPLEKVPQDTRHRFVSRAYKNGLKQAR